MLDQFVGQTLANKYRIDSELRRSDSGKMYRATHLLMDTPVAVKILAPALAADENVVRNFSGEARTVSRISHPNILNVTDFGSDVNGNVYTVYEGAAGETLKETISREGRFSLDRAVRIAWQIASALSAAHHAGVIHHRLNAENILLAQTSGAVETVKILDFGAAKNDNQAAFDHETELKDLEYLAPEQNASVTSGDERSDVYALGVIFYEMLAGAVPFTAESQTALMLKQAENPPPPLSSFRRDLPEAIEPVVLNALAKNPEMRYQTANEFVNALNRASNNIAAVETVTAANFADASPETANNNLWKTAFVVLAGISLLAIGMIYATQVKQTDVPTAAMQTDANGQPVQPLNPATGMSEQSLANMSGYPSMPPPMENVNGVMMMPPQIMPPSGSSSDGLSERLWSAQGPPPGAPPSAYVGPGGAPVMFGNGNSVFMPNEDGTGYYLVPVPAANANVNVPTPAAPKTGKATAASPTPGTQPTPNQQPPPAEVKSTPAPKTAATPAAKPATTPKPTAPAASGAKKDGQ